MHHENGRRRRGQWRENANVRNKKIIDITNKDKDILTTIKVTFVEGTDQDDENPSGGAHRCGLHRSGKGQCDTDCVR